MPNQTTLRTRDAILEAFVKLLDRKSYEKITVADIAQKTGIARQTFYQHFKDKDAVVLYFLTMAIDKNAISIVSESENRVNGKVIITYHSVFINKNPTILKTLLNNEHLYTMMFRLGYETINSAVTFFKTKLPPKEYAVCRTKLYYQLSGEFTAFFDWLNSDMTISVEELVFMLNELSRIVDESWQNLPGIEVRLD